jgi:hypothetical protein
MDSYVETLQGLVESQNTFLGRTINQFRPIERLSVYNQYMLNERMYLELLYRILRVSQNTQQVVVNIPASFMDPVSVTPTETQIANSLENVPNPTGNCAICQDTLTNNTVRIRQCDHSYHRDCINSWFTLSVRCPVCRHDIREHT